MFNFNAKFDADLLFCSLCHFECDGHKVHILTEQHLPPLTSTVKSSLFTHAHSSPLSLAARLHRCHANCSCYIKNGWNFPRPMSYSYIYNLLWCYLFLRYAVRNATLVVEMRGYGSPWGGWQWKEEHALRRKHLGCITLEGGTGVQQAGRAFQAEGGARHGHFQGSMQPVRWRAVLEHAWSCWPSIPVPAPHIPGPSKPLSQ